jgi:hypothetical protein
MGQHRTGISWTDLHQLHVDGVDDGTIAEIARRHQLDGVELLVGPEPSQGWPAGPPRRPQSSEEWVFGEHVEASVKAMLLAEARAEHERSLWWQLERSFYDGMRWDVLVEAGLRAYPVAG